MADGREQRAGGGGNGEGRGGRAARRGAWGTWATAALALSATVCAPSRDETPQIRVVPGAASRALWIGREPEARDRARPSRVHSMREGEALSGPNAIGRPGDLVLENDEVVFVIERIDRSSGFAESGGNLVDAADARARFDELGQSFTFFGTFPRQAVYDKLTSGVAPDGTAWIQAEGRELLEPAVAVKTRYSLAKHDRALLLETTVTNTGQAPTGKLGFGDVVQWGGAEKVVPGKPPGFHGTSTSAFIGGVGRFVSYAIASTDGDVDAINGVAWSDTFQQRDVVLAPGKSASYTRVFVVGERPDTSSVVAELTKAAGQPVGALEVQLVDEGGKPVPAPPGARVVLQRNGQEVLSLATREGGGPLVGEVPPGPYELAFAGGGGRRASRAALTRVDVQVGRVSRATLSVTRGGRAKLSCVESRVGANGAAQRAASPCKFTLEGQGGTPTPDLGPSHVTGPARNCVVTHDGVADVPLAPGTYRVTASRGPEYTAPQAALTVSEDPLAPAEQELVIERVVDTRGYLAADFHQHTMLGADAPVAVRDRVISNVAEGVEVAVASEHNVIADLQPHVRALHLERELVEIPGVELTTDANPKSWGHANVFPIAPDPAKSRGGAPSVRGRTAREVFAEFRRRPQPFVLQINHPRAGRIGYFDQLKFDRATGASSDPGYDPDFDALEVWNGRNVTMREAVLKDYFAILRSGRPLTPSANTDTHGVVGHEAGYPRTYVRVSDDGPLDAWGPSRVDDLLQGVRERRDVVLSNGPFLRVSVKTEAEDYGEAIGKVVRGRKIAITVRVACAPWVEVDRVRVERLGAAEGKGQVEERAVVLAPRAGAREAEVRFSLRVTKDDAFVVAASGSRPLSPVLDGDPKEILPYAVTGAVWIDADGDGRSLGRKR